ncbi:MAG: HAMP domain-containing histidine kinase [Candidatus Aminicenantes bacterium]|nr:HAMP domain-containing histidine kinase [Candidatus Aminicenantes bacterium]
METVQLKRPKTLGYLILAVLSAFLVCAAAFRCASKTTDERIHRAIAKNVGAIELDTKTNIRTIENRAGNLFEKYRAGALTHSEPGAKEALIIVENGEITKYYGEIYHFSPRNLAVGEWRLIKMSEIVYFVKQLAPDVFYAGFFININDNFILDKVKDRFSIAELKFSQEQSKEREDVYRYDDRAGLFSYHHLLKYSGEQISLQLRFSRNDIEKYSRRNGRFFLYLSILFFLVVQLCYFYRKQRATANAADNRVNREDRAGNQKGCFGRFRQTVEQRRYMLAAGICWIAVFIDLYLLIALSRADNLYLELFSVTFHSTYQLLIILIIMIALLYFFREKLKYRTFNYLAFNLSAAAALYLSGRVFKAADFVYADFKLSAAYLSLFFVIFLLHLLPLFFIRNFFYEKKVSHLVMVSSGQALVIILGYYFGGLNPVDTLLFSIILLISIFTKKGFMQRSAIVFLLALSIFSLAARSTIADKKDFISENLKNIFLNQDNYARFIAREMVHEINSRSSSLYDFFQECDTAKLVDIWRMSIARKENIASGIFLISKDGETRNQYSYQMPFLELPSQEFFPFWAIQETNAALYGKEISLAIAAASVKKGTDHLGYIIIQVLNSPRLILKHQDEINIFTIDQEINGKDLSYIKLNEENQAIENPSNINLENVAGILQNNDRWITFNYAGLNFTGYIFRDERNPIIIFFPRNTFFKNFSEIIKIYLFMLFLFLLFYFKELSKADWKSVYYSFSIRVFAILILISLLTTVIFSVFSLNFNTQATGRKLRQLEYEKGVTAQNIGYNLFKDSSEITQDNLLLMSEILNSDVSIYENNVLLDSSNQRKYIDAELPIYLNSHILSRLNEKNQKFVTSNDGGSLYFKIGNYIFDVEFSYNWQKMIVEKGYHTDFIITLFFILAVIGFSAAFFFRNKILSPIDELNRAMAEVARGNLEKLEEIPSEKEIESLYVGFNAMVDGVRREKENISEISRMKAVIRLGRRVAHEVKNPLTPIKLSAEQILKTLHDRNPGYEEIIKKSVRFIMDETEHLRKVSYGFLDLSRLDEIMAVKFDLLESIKEEIFNFSQVYHDVDFVVKAENGNYVVFLDKIKIKQVLINLLVNSIEAFSDGKGRIILHLEDKTDVVSMKVIDNGSGMEPGQLEKIFNIDYSTKEIGTGIGLFVVKRIVELHKGKIEIETGKDRGTTIILELPKNVEES